MSSDFEGLSDAPMDAKSLASRARVRRQASVQNHQTVQDNAMDDSDMDSDFHPAGDAGAEDVDAEEDEIEIEDQESMQHSVRQGVNMTMTKRFLHIDPSFVSPSEYASHNNQCYMAEKLSLLEARFERMEEMLVEFASGGGQTRNRRYGSGKETSRSRSRSQKTTSKKGTPDDTVKELINLYFDDLATILGEHKAAKGKILKSHSINVEKFTKAFFKDCLFNAFKPGPDDKDQNSDANVRYNAFKALGPFQKQSLFVTMCQNVYGKRKKSSEPNDEEEAE